MFKLIRRLIKLMLLCIIFIMIYFVIQTNPFKHQYNDISETSNVNNASTFTLENIALFSNIPLSQVKNVFKFMDKKEFMDVSGLTLMGYNEDYLIGQRGSDFIMYPFGAAQVYVFNNESDLNQALNERNISIHMQDRSYY